MKNLLFMTFFMFSFSSFAGDNGIVCSKAMPDGNYDDLGGAWAPVENRFASLEFTDQNVKYLVSVDRRVEPNTMVVVYLKEREHPELKKFQVNSFYHVIQVTKDIECMLAD